MLHRAVVGAMAGAIDRERELDSLQLEVAEMLAPLGKISLATPFKSIRRVVVQHPTMRASVRLIISPEFRGRAYLVSVLKIVDDDNARLTHANNYTIRNVPACGADLQTLFTQVKETLDVLADVSPPM